MSETNINKPTMDRYVTIDDRTVYGFQKCLFCSNGRALYSEHVVLGIFICDDCKKIISERKESHKSSWIPNSKGGEPNCRRE